MERKSFFAVFGVCAGLCAWGALAPFETLRKSGVHSFTYDGKPFSLASPVSDEQIAETDRFVVRRMVYRSPDGKLELRDTWKLYKKFPAAEVLPELVCLADGGTALVDGFKSVDLRVDAKRAFVRALTGTTCTERDFMPVDQTLTPEGKRTALFDVVEGRSSSTFMPWFGVDLPDGNGFEIGLGWTGGWTARFSLEGESLCLRAGMRRTHFRLLKGETLRQPSTLFFRREGMSVPEVRTALHRFMLDEKMPRDSKGALIKPLLPVTAGGGNKKDEVMLDILDWSVKNGLPFDAFWVDAAWYGPPHDPDPYSNCGDKWWPYTGYWKFNPNVHPDGNLLRVSEAVAERGMRFLMWFEPERSMDNMPFAQEHPAWMLPADWQKSADPKKPVPILADLGNPECRAFIVEMISKFIRENKLAVYRQDFNMDPAGLWSGNDAPDRVGVTEAKYIAGLYAFWDELRRRFPDLLIENCASGGRRLDFEMVSRSHSYCRTDYAIGHRGTLDQVLNVQNITLNTLCYQPFQGSETTPAAMFDDYGFFSSVCAGSVFTPSDWDGGIVRREFTEKETVWLRKVFRAADRMRTAFMGDFYPQTEPATLARSRWVAYQQHRPDLKSGFALVFRRPDCAGDSFTFALKGLDPAAEYTVERYDGETRTLTGADLAKLSVQLKDPLSFALFFYELKSAKPNARIVHDPVQALVAAFDANEINPFTDAAGATWAVLRRVTVEGGEENIYGARRFTTGPGRLCGVESVPNSYVAANSAKSALLELGMSGGGRNRVEPGELVFHPEPSTLPGGGRTVLRFTVPQDGRYTLRARFRSGNFGPGRVDVSVVLDGRIQWQKELVRDGKPTSATETCAFDARPLKAGQHLEIVVGSGLKESDHCCDATMLKLSLSRE